MTTKVSKNNLRPWFPSCCSATVLLLLLILCSTWAGHCFGQTTVPTAGDKSPQAQYPATETLSKAEKSFLESLDERIAKIDRNVQQMSHIGALAESRSLEIKVMARTLIRLEKGIIVALSVIAIGFPLIIWLLSKKRLLGLSGLSDEVAATILVVEERQAKLAEIMEEMQSELDEGYARTSPDMKNLMEQAKRFLEQNKRDLERVGSGRNGSEDK